MSRLRLIETEKFVGCRDRDSSRLKNFLDVETETQRDWEICWMLRPRLIKTWKFGGCPDRDSSRLGNLLDVETETSRDWAKDVDTETPSRLSLISVYKSSNVNLWISRPYMKISSFLYVCTYMQCRTHPIHHVEFYWGRLYFLRLSPFLRYSSFLRSSSFLRFSSFLRSSSLLRYSS